MISEPEHSVCDDMVKGDLICPLAEQDIDAFLQRSALNLLFFAGRPSVRRESHDVAVALRELLKDYHGQLGAGLVDGDTEDALKARFRVAATPCLVFLARDEVLEVVPRVRDWAEYAALFQRYLGRPTAPTLRKSA